MMPLARFVLLAAAYAVATYAAGWWVVPLVAAGFAAITRAQRGSAALSGFAAIVGWAALLAITASQGPVGTLAAELGGVLQLKPAAVYAVTLAFPGLLAVSAAVVGRALVSPRR